MSNNDYLYPIKRRLRRMISFLQVEGLTKSFGDLVLFENLTFGIFEGDRIGLIAKNGTGKTTLLNIILLNLLLMG